MAEASLQTRLVQTLEQNVALGARVDELTHVITQRTAELETTRKIQADLRETRDKLMRTNKQCEEQAQTIGNLNRQLATMRDSEQQARVRATELQEQMTRLTTDNDNLKRSVHTYSSEARQRKKRETDTKERDTELDAIVSEARANLTKLGDPVVTPETLDMAMTLALNAALNNDLSPPDH